MLNVKNNHEGTHSNPLFIVALFEEATMVRLRLKIEKVKLDLTEALVAATSVLWPVPAFSDCSAVLLESSQNILWTEKHIEEKQ